MKSNFIKTKFTLIPFTLFCLAAIWSHQIENKEVLFFSFCISVALLIVCLSFLIHGIYLRTRKMNQKSINQHATAEGFEDVDYEDTDFKYNPDRNGY